MLQLLRSTLRSVVASGDLTIIDHAGTRHRFGDGSGAPIIVRLADAALEREIVIDPQLAAGEGYMHGRLVMEAGTIFDLVALMMRNLSERPFPALARSRDALRRLTRRLSQYNPAARARANVARHYDIDGAIYDLFLDPDRQYSCAYFTPGADLAEAQLAKKRHIAAKLALADGHRVLDIGSGWGGLALYLARVAGADVTGITLSENQIRIARQRAVTDGLGNRVRFLLEDYRHAGGRYDRVVSVGMLEHVGVNHYGTFFRKLSDLLADDGVALVHSIGRIDGPGATSPFIARYIFPGGYIPALSEVLPAIERAGLVVTDVEILRLHYALTLKAWRERFMARRAEAVRARGETFARMWEFYLAASEAAFRHDGLMVFQIQIAKRVDTLPITRGYMADAEARLASAEAGAGPIPMAGE